MIWYVMLCYYYYFVSYFHFASQFYMFTDTKQKEITKTNGKTNKKLMLKRKVLIERKTHWLCKVLRKNCVRGWVCLCCWVCVWTERNRSSKIKQQNKQRVKRKPWNKTKRIICGIMFLFSRVKIKYAASVCVWVIYVFGYKF